MILVAALGSSLLTAPAAHAEGDIVLDCAESEWERDEFRANIPGSMDEYVNFTAVGENGATIPARSMYLLADHDTGIGDQYLGTLQPMRANGLTPPYSITVTDQETGDVLAEGSLVECDEPRAEFMWPPFFPGSDVGRWTAELPSNDFMAWRHEEDGSLTAVAKGQHRWHVYTRHDDYVNPAPKEVNLGMAPGSEEQVRFDVFLCASWGGDDDGFWVWSSGPGVEEHVTLQYANRSAGWTDVAGSGPQVPEGYVWHAEQSPYRYALPHAPGLMWAGLKPSDGPVSLRALDPEGRVVGQRTYDNYCGVTFDPATYTVVDRPAAKVTEDGSWVVPEDDATYQWTLEADGELVVRLLPLLTTFPDGGITHNYGLPVVEPDPEPVPGPEVVRLEGEDRFDTAAKLAVEHYTPGLDIVYLATGRNFPDALAGAALAGTDEAPILLSKEDSLPRATVAALRTLSPKRVVAFGGQDVIQESVLEQIRAEGVAVTRVAGGNRYETAALVSQQLAATDAVYLASGLDYPDAMAAAAVAGRTGAPVLLSKAGSIPSATLKELRRRNPHVVYILGGTTALSDAVEQHVEDLGHTTVRVGGGNRYETAALLAAGHDDGFSEAWVATGLDFADALAAAPLAAREGGPILLTKTESLPSATGSALVAGQPSRVTMLGGSSAITDAVKELIADLPWRG